MKYGGAGITIIIVLLLLIFFAIIAIFASQQAQPNSLTRAQVCGNQRDVCMSNCQSKTISYFCEKQCQDTYQQCMNNY